MTDKVGIHLGNETHLKCPNCDKVDKNLVYKECRAVKTKLPDDERYWHPCPSAIADGYSCGLCDCTEEGMKFCQDEVDEFAEEFANEEGD